MKNSILPLHLNLAETVRKKEDKYFGAFFCGINLPPESGTTTSEHPADFSSYISIPLEKSSIIFGVYFHPLTFCLNMSSPLLLQASFTTSTAYMNRRLVFPIEIYQLDFNL